MSNPAGSTRPSQGSQQAQSEMPAIFSDAPDAPVPAILNPSPDINDLIERMVQERLVDIQRQTEAQLEAWNAQEAAMSQQIQNLQTELVRASSLHTNAANPMQVTRGSNIMQDSLMGDEHVPNAANSGDQPEGSNRRKRRRTTATVTQSNSEASLISQSSRVTRSETRRRAALSDAHNVDGNSNPMPTPMPATVVSSSVAALAPPQAGATAQPMPANTFAFSPAAIAPTSMPKSVKKKKKPVVKAKAEIYRYLPQEMPLDMGGLHKAISLHLRILWGLLDANEVPKNPPDEIVSSFNKRFSTEAQLYASQNSDRDLYPRHLVQIGTAMSVVQTGRIANQARLVEEHMLDYVQARLAKIGLPFWCPDLRHSAYSLYNSAHRIVALDTFRQALVSHTYIHLNPNAAYASTSPILIRLFDHFVFHYMKLRYQREGRHPGTVTRSLRNNPQYVARIRLAESRTNFLVENNYPQRYRDLIKPKSTSDDEYDPVRKVWIIKRRRERSHKANTFVRILDRKREAAARQENPRKWRERVRVEAGPDEEADSQFQSLPEGMPIDYFDPGFFNQLQPRTRNRVAIHKVAFLPNVNQSLTWNAAERISDSVFTRKYGDAVFDQYQMVSDVDMADYDGADADDEWMADEDDTLMSDTPTTRGGARTADPEAITLSRNALSAHLSASGTTLSSNSNLSQTTQEHSGQISGSASDLSQGRRPDDTLSSNHSFYADADSTQGL